MTKKEVKERIQNINWRDDDEDIYKKIVEIVTEYQDSGEDSKLDCVLKDYMTEEDAIDYITKIMHDNGLEDGDGHMEHICNFTHVYRKDAWGYLEEANLEALCENILDLLGLSYDEEDD